MSGKLSKYQKFEVEVISRGEIHGADYNPRVISEDARQAAQEDAGEARPCPAACVEPEDRQSRFGTSAAFTARSA